MIVTSDDLRQGYRAGGLGGAAFCVHSSLRSFGLVEGGASTVVEAALNEGCTMMVPTFSFTFAIPPPPNMQPVRNGFDYGLAVSDPLGVGRVFNTDSNEMNDRSMGAIPAALLRQHGRMRGNHALNSFSAVGPLAGDLVDCQEANDVYAPLRRLIELEGYIVLMGVGLTSMTLIHLAERMAGRTLFRRWANDASEMPMMLEVGSCSTAFDRFGGVLAPLERRIEVGKSTWRIFPAGASLEAATRAIRANPEITHCGKARCRCNDAVLGGPIL